MTDFLQFLNTASAETLTQIPGISQSLAENLIAARPFETAEDCLKVRGMGRKLLANVQAWFENSEIPSVEETPLALSQQAEPPAAPPQKSAPTAESPAPAEKPSFGSRLGRAFLWFFRALLRLILMILIIGGIGALIIYGAPLVNEKFLTPVEQNAARVSQLEGEVQTLQMQLNEIQAQVNASNSRLDELQQAIEAHTASIEKLAEMQSTLELQIKENADKTLLALKDEILMTRVLDTLARARLYLAQSNFGLAREDVQSARDLLAEVQANSQDEAQAQALARLDMALGNLPAFPVIASGDLEIAWQILMTGRVVPTATPEPTATATPTPETTPTPPASVTATP
ncbi:MAG: helix-hairpin-helix domain-containing protein [Chloroflexota bacterium]|jgi:hypothetical protein